MKRLWDRAKNKKGFTLVELIVVLVILSILAAILLPSLLGWVDEAKSKQYVLEARNILIATQAQLSTAYATGSGVDLTVEDSAMVAKIESISEVTDILNMTVNGAGVIGANSPKAAYSISTMTVQYISASDGKTVTAVLNGGGAASDSTGWVITE